MSNAFKIYVRRPGHQRCEQLTERSSEDVEWVAAGSDKLGKELCQEQSKSRYSRWLGEQVYLSDIEFFMTSAKGCNRHHIRNWYTSGSLLWGNVLKLPQLIDVIHYINYKESSLTIIVFD